MVLGIRMVVTCAEEAVVGGEVWRGGLSSGDVPFFLVLDFITPVCSLYNSLGSMLCTEQYTMQHKSCAFLCEWYLSLKK